ncbi:ABC transporter substrate-binding protein [Mesorhizobium sp. YC-39]|uniref:ABC transporter substrate-binding protein n=1 Tax=unclassified Mesorhizobium TaxID=325217 RepID=UPI0021E791E3|nr:MULTISPECIES: ABC transporter substrate-binding protein [unclassified Mesorhizobium]MCV3210829.1 ABC transporter substrate-binding protein [Mesorhizobium sp. YC-2]MCV3231063.1 ABC transporter substrate-binding protein [Mesorhizobium sp. YC-39]
MSDSAFLEMKFWAEQARKGGISRREFLGRAAALAAVAGAGTSFFASGAQAQEPKQGGFARFGMSDASQQDTLDPGTWPASFVQAAFSGSLCNNLTEIAADGSIIGDLAESFEPADGARKWTFKIKKGITFHDGKSLTMADIQESFRHHMGDGSTSAAKSLLSQIDTITPDGPDTIVFNLKSGTADFPYLVADYHLSIIPAKEGGGIDWQRGVGTGSFTLENFEPGVSIKMKRNPNYHKNNKPYFDEIEYVAIMDATARMNAFMTGEVEFIGDLDVKSIGLMERNPALSVLRVPSLRHFTFDMDTSTAPFDNPDVRLALKYAIDRDDIVRKVFLGEAIKGNDSPVASTMPFHIEPKPVFNYDIDKAKAHLAKAGLTSLDVDLSVAEAAFPGAIDAAVLFQQHAAKAGININIVREADDGYWENVFLKKPFNGCDWYGRPTCDWLFSTSYSKDASWNNTHWKNQRFNELLVEARSETDQAKRATQYAEMQQILHDDGGVLTVAFVNWIVGVSAKIGHGQVGGIFPCDNLRMSERWWMV